ncbi:hypothetical protein Tco_1556926 [Tanacetum coccineum]
MIGVPWPPKQFYGNILVNIALAVERILPNGTIQRILVGQIEQRREEIIPFRVKDALASLAREHMALGSTGLLGYVYYIDPEAGDIAVV